MNNKRISLIVSIALAIALLSTAMLAPQAALANSGGGSGTLIADGDGLAGIRGSGTVSISGNGILWIRDHAGDASINVSGDGIRSDLPNGWIRYSGFNGSAVVSGSQITVALSGYSIHLEATGTGQFVLRGNGSYTVEKNGIIVTGAWTEGAEVQNIP
jgi:hypothetical protein